MNAVLRISRLDSRRLAASEDKVRRGNLRWIKARKVPTLVPFFNARAAGSPMPPVISTTVAETPIIVEPPSVSLNVPTVRESEELGTTDPTTDRSSTAAIAPVTVTVGPYFCANHQSRPSTFLCQTCNLSLCRDCVKTFGSSVLLCGHCGGMANPKKKVAAEQQTAEFRTAAISKGFGFGDFGEALVYPFKFKISLFFGEAIYMFFSVGKLAAAMGGMYMIAAAILQYAPTC